MEMQGTVLYLLESSLEDVFYSLKPGTCVTKNVLVMLEF